VYKSLSFVQLSDISYLIRSCENPGVTKRPCANIPVPASPLPGTIQTALPSFYVPPPLYPVLNEHLSLSLDQFASSANKYQLKAMGKPFSFEDGCLLVCSLVDVYQRFRGTYCLHHQGDECVSHGSLLTVVMEGVRTSETSLNVYQTTRLNIPENSHVHNRRRDNVKIRRLHLPHKTIALCMNCGHLTMHGWSHKMARGCEWFSNVALKQPTNKSKSKAVPQPPCRLQGGEDV
jgi:hypothetical protein